MNVPTKFFTSGYWRSFTIKLPIVGMLALMTIGILTTRTHAVVLTAVAYNSQAPYQSRLLTIDSSNPSTPLSSVTLSGGDPGSTLGSVDQFVIGAIDIRNSDGILYGLGVRSGSAQKLYTLNPITGAATSVPGISPTRSGSSFGFEFDAIGNQARVSTDGNNFFINNNTLNSTTGTITSQTNFAYAVGDVNFGATPNIASIAATNDFFGAASQTLYGIDRLQKSLVQIGSPNGSPNSPNTGLLSTIGPLNLPGVVNLPTSGAIAFEILPNNTAFAAIQLTGAHAGYSVLYSINLSTGAATELGSIVTNNSYVYGLLYVPEPSGTSLCWVALVGMRFASQRIRRIRKKATL